MFTRTLGLVCLLGLCLELGSSQTICPTGKWGGDCELDCSSNCLKNCHKVTGTCDDACVVGRYDSHCDKICDCTFGCDKETGYCPCDVYGCDTCNTEGTSCSRCHDTSYFDTSSNDPTKCCSLGCHRNHFGILDCDRNGDCTVAGCLDGYWGLKCTICIELISNCEICKSKQNSTELICLQCLPGYDVSVDQRRCCPPGCDDCNGDICSVCKQEYYIYNEICDTCGDNCQPPGNGTARCDPVTGDCLYNCLDGWHGSKCDVECTHKNCETCDFKESDRLLTCKTCVEGWAPNELGLCQPCNSNCVNSLCNSTTGYCTEGCMPGWRSDRCDQSCEDADMGNCTICGRDSFTCSECMFDFWGATCENSCSQNCVPVDSGHVCAKDDAACMSGCMPGYWREDCNLECPNCHNDVCQIADGVCQDLACKPGYWGRDCMRPCSTNCSNNPATGDFECQFETGNCTHGCKYNQFGVECEMTCSSHCLDNRTTTDEEPLCNQKHGDCKYGCENNYYNPDCSDVCASTCVTGQCDRVQGFCLACLDVPKGWLCADGNCDKGLHGLFCNKTCPANCQGGECIRDTGLCQFCNPTWYDPTCDQRCLYCEGDVCLQSNGHCIRGCKDGFYTDKCDVRCLYDGCQDCTRDSGTCITCKVGKFNNTCSDDCSPQCETTDLGFRTCSKASGYCDANECIDGFWSETCREECSPFCVTDACDLISGQCDPCLIGYFGPTCRSICSTNCKNSNCKGTRDTCVEGCANGFWGTACEKKCNDNCVQNMCNIDDGTCSQGCQGDEFYGPTCKEPCNSNCASGQCQRDGYCIGLCKSQTYGYMCENACPVNAMCTDKTCDRRAGNCSECDAVVPGPLCPTAKCESGRTGPECKQNCTSRTCLYNRCTRDTDVCVGCNIGIQGTYCDEPCGNCKVGTGCDQLSGVCNEGCRDGYHGAECDQACDPVCESCERDPPAQCVVCRENRWGSNCQNNCSANCAKTVIGTLTYTRCEKDSGACSEGACKDHRFWDDDCSIQCPINCFADRSGYKTCRISDGACSNGCDATFYGPQCTGKCSIQCKDQVCENSANNCIRGCADGFYNPPTCSSICSPNCLNPGRCNTVDGTCIGGCKDGYFGERCREACFGKCTDGKCDDEGGCPDCRLSPVGPLCHPQVCPSLKYGPSCESDCPGLYCLDGTCDRQSGECPQGCLSWYHGEYCSERCICHTAGTVACNQAGVCQCKVGWTSVDCSQTCSDGCRNSECEKNGQCTLGCINGRYGSTCENSCSNCVNEDCDSSTGECRVGCKSGFYGGRCDENCPDNCAACESSARCTQCASYLYGLPTCKQTCSDNCKPRSDRICMESNGACVDGCNTGFWGSKCDKECGFCKGDGECSSVDGFCTEGCEVGYYTPKCTMLCSTRCVVGALSDTPECDVATGACTYGCVDGYYGNTCEECSDNCLGKKCSSATVCTDGCKAAYYSKNTGCNLDCSRCKSGSCNDTGHCISGCEGGFYGPQCQTVCSKTCKDETCDQTTGECADCSKKPIGPLCKDEVVVTETEVERLPTAGIIGISAGCAVAVIIIVILMVVCIFYRRKASDAKHEIHLPSDMIDRLSTHRSHHSTISSQYPVARVVGDDEKDFVLF